MSLCVLKREEEITHLNRFFFIRRMEEESQELGMSFPHSNINDKYSKPKFFFDIL